MRVIYKKCCGLDVHKKKLDACMMKGKIQEINEFGATTKGIKRKLDGYLMINVK